MYNIKKESEGDRFMIKWDCIEKLHDERLIAEFEQEIGWVLPESYKAFVKENNSCQPKFSTMRSVGFLLLLVKI